MYTHSYVYSRCVSRGAVFGVSLEVSLACSVEVCHNLCPSSSQRTALPPLTPPPASTVGWTFKPLCSKPCNAYLLLQTAVVQEGRQDGESKSNLVIIGSGVLLFATIT